MRLLPLCATTCALVAAAAPALAEDAPPRPAWLIVELAGRPPEGEPQLGFEPGGQVFGTSGCNSFQGSATQEGAMLTFSPLASTRMACAEGLMAQEEAVFRLFSQPLAVSYDAPLDRMTLTAPGGESMVLQRP